MDARWTSHELPVLEAVATITFDETRARAPIDLGELAQLLGRDLGSVRLSVQILADAGYLKLDGGIGAWTINSITERGLRATGAWPDDAAVLADRVVAALDERADSEPEPETRSRLRAASGALTGVGRDLLVDVMGAVITRATGAG